MAGNASRQPNLLRRHPLAAFYFLALLFSWSVEIPLVAVRQGWVSVRIPFAVHYLAAFGPGLAAVIVTAATGGARGLKELWQRIILWRAGRGWALFAVLSPLAFFALSLPVVRLVKGTWPDLRLLGQANFLPYLGPGVVVLWLVSYGMGEEVGWRGFALPRLQRTKSVTMATLLLGLMWAFWHLPAFFYLDTLREIGLAMIPGFMISVLFSAVVFTWLYNGTGGSILWVAVWHGLFDLCTASKVAQDVIPVVMSAAVIILVLVITRVKQPWNFHSLKMHVLPTHPPAEKTDPTAFPV